MQPTWLRPSRGHFQAFTRLSISVLGRWRSHSVAVKTNFREGPPGVSPGPEAGTTLAKETRVLRHPLSVCSSLARRRRPYSTLARRSSLMAQFQRVKAQFPDHLLLFQVGDFYELYGDDASEAAAKTSLRLTKKAGVLMAGFPVRSLDEWQRILVEAGLQLAICNQQPSKKDQSSGSTLMEREVVRLVTPGTLTEPLDQAANYLLSIAPGPTSSLGLAWADLSTAEFMVSSVGVASLDEDLERLCPSEVLLPKAVTESLQGNLKVGVSNLAMMDGLLQSSQLKECHVTAVPAEWYREEEGVATAYQYQWYMNGWKEGQFSKLERSAVCALLRYISHTHRHLVPRLLPPSPFTHSQHMAIDASTRRALELIHPQPNNPRKTTLLGCMDRTVTAGGARLLRARLAAPLTDVSAINRRLDVVELFRSLPIQREAIRLQLRSCTDLERALQKVATMSCSAADLRAIKTTLHTAGSILHYIREMLPDSVSVLADETCDLREIPELVNELEEAVGESSITYFDYISPGYSTVVDSLREKMRENEAAVQTLVSSLQEETGVSRLGVVSYKTYGRVLEVSKTQAVKLEKYPHLIRIDQTQAKTRFTHVALQKLNTELHNLETCYVETQGILFQQLCDKVMSYADDVMKTAASLARLDVGTSLALLAEDKKYTRPRLEHVSLFRVEQGFHPVLGSVTQCLPHQFVSNDCYMDTHRQWVVTGPNMGGKSTFLRQNGLLVVMAQMGSFVPAKEAVVGVVDRLFARVGATDNVARHMSTFHVEMAETASILTMATRHSFVILDEIGRGTSPTEGLAIAQAVVEYLSQRIGCRGLIASHYHQLGKLADRVTGVGSYKVVADHNKGGLIFTYRVMAGRAECSFGIEVAELAGMPIEVIGRAKELLQS